MEILGSWPCRAPCHSRCGVLQHEARDAASRDCARLGGAEQRDAGKWRLSPRESAALVPIGGVGSPPSARFLRAALLGERRADSVGTARSKGLRERDVIGGAVVTAAVFTYPGIGRLLIQAIDARDDPLIQGCIMFILVIYIATNVFVDVLYAYIDSRIECG